MKRIWNGSGSKGIADTYWRGFVNRDKIKKKKIIRFIKLINFEFMKAVIRKHLNVEHIEQIAHENKYDKPAYQLFINEIEKDLIKELHRGFTQSSEASILNKVVEFITEVEAFRKKGYGIEWAAEYVYRSHRPEKAHALAFACQAVRALSSSEIDNLKLYARLTGRDKYFVEYFNILLDEPNTEVVYDEPIEESSDLYSNQIKKLISEGKSKQYAIIYSFYSAVKVYPPYGCHIAGMEAEMVKKNKIDVDGDLFDYIEDISGYIYSNFETYEDSLTDEKVNKMRTQYIEFEDDFRNM
jgi:hypothetical protein